MVNSSSPIKELELKLNIDAKSFAELESIEREYVLSIIHVLYPELVVDNLQERMNYEPAFGMRRIYMLDNERFLLETRLSGDENNVILYIKSPVER